MVYKILGLLTLSVALSNCGEPIKIADEDNSCNRTIRVVMPALEDDVSEESVDQSVDSPDLVLLHRGAACGYTIVSVGSSYFSIISNLLVPVTSTKRRLRTTTLNGVAYDCFVRLNSDGTTSEIFKEL